MADNKQKKVQQAARTANVLESLKDIGADVKNTAGQEFLKNTPQDFVDQLFGIGTSAKISGEITVGESIDVKEVMTSQDGSKSIERSMHFERNIYAQEKDMIDRRTNELRMQLNAIMQEVVVITEKTQDLAQEAQIASMQAPVEPGVYHLIFFENILSFLKSFSKKISEASLWLHSANSRASKKNMWGANYKKHGAKYLLSGEHYLQRSAG